MPDRAVVDEFVGMVEANLHVDALERFYTSNASMQENQESPRFGLTAHVANERRVLAAARSLSSKCVRPVLIEGDTVVIRWIFEFEWANSTTTRIEEITHQTWVGDRIETETFFFDPAQRKPRSTAAKSVAD